MFFKWLAWQVEASGRSCVTIAVCGGHRHTRDLLMVMGPLDGFAIVGDEPPLPVVLPYKAFIRELPIFHNGKKEKPWKRKRYF